MWKKHLLSDINYLETGRMKLDRRPFDLVEALQEVVRNLSESLDARQQKLIIDVARDLPEVDADRMRVSRVLDNLIKNSNLYTPDGGSTWVAQTTPVDPSFWGVSFVR